MDISEFSVSQAREICHGLFTPRPTVYWFDFLVSLAVGYSSAIIFLSAPPFAWYHLLCFAMAVIALYRAASFMHEIVHFRRDQMRTFNVTWNLLAGVPMLTPSFFYESHITHHNTHYYGTGGDGEYLPLGNGPLRNVARFLSQVLFQPIFVVARFLLTPVIFLHPALRRWTLQNASSFVINLRFQNRTRDDVPRLEWALIEWACFLRTAAIFAFVLLGFAPWTRIPMLYSVAVGILTLNHLRTLAAHRYTSSGQTMTHQDQFFDSTNVTGDPIFTEMLCPVGLRYHALHHLFPTMPYHNLGTAHRRLMQRLPRESAYRSNVYSSCWSVFKELVDHARDRRRWALADQWFADRHERLKVSRLDPDPSPPVFSDKDIDRTGSSV